MHIIRPKQLSLQRTARMLHTLNHPEIVPLEKTEILTFKLPFFLSHATKFRFLNRLKFAGTRVDFASVKLFLITYKGGSYDTRKNKWTFIESIPSIF